jgi:hypothetical protein
LALGVALARGPAAMSDWLACIAGAAVIPLWAAILPHHTAEHSPMMVRILAVPIALGWLGLTWQTASIFPNPGLRGTFTKSCASTCSSSGSSEAC